MSLEYRMQATEKELVAFLASEYIVGSGIPVHLYSIVNATFKKYNRSLAITDNDKGTLIFEGRRTLKAYGQNDPRALIRALNRCNVGVK